MQETAIFLDDDEEKLFRRRGRPSKWAKVKEIRTSAQESDAATITQEQKPQRCHDLSGALFLVEVASGEAFESTPRNHFKSIKTFDFEVERVQIGFPQEKPGFC
jgi:hypothetical protein